MTVTTSDQVRIAGLPQDPRRGSLAMGWFIASETALFACLFFAYFFLGHSRPAWPPHEPPKLMWASIMLGLLLASSVVLYIGERLRRAHRLPAARLAVGITLIMGLGFIALQVIEYREHFKSLLPTTDSYGSIFYAITSFHGAHVILGLAMLFYVLVLPDLEPGKSPFKPLHNASMYWHFVDVVWIFVVCILYYLPNLVGGGGE